MRGGGLVGKFWVWTGGTDSLHGAASHPIGSGMRSAMKPYVSAEIPPAGAPLGFDGTPQAFALK